MCSSGSEPVGGVWPGLGATCLRVPPPAARDARLRAGGERPRRGSGSRASAAERQVGGGAPGAAALPGGFAGGCGRPLSLDGRAHRPGVPPGGPLEARGLRGGGLAPPGAVGVADPALRGFLQMGLRGRGAGTGPARVRFSCVQVWPWVCSVRTTGLVFFLTYLYATIWSAGASVFGGGGKLRKCRPFVLRSSLTVYILAFFVLFFFFFFAPPEYLHFKNEEV